MPQSAFFLIELNWHTVEEEGIEICQQKAAVVQCDVILCLLIRQTLQSQACKLLQRSISLIIVVETCKNCVFVGLCVRPISCFLHMQSQPRYSPIT